MSNNQAGNNEPVFYDLTVPMDTFTPAAAPMAVPESPAAPDHTLLRPSEWTAGYLLSPDVLQKAMSENADLALHILRGNHDSVRPSVHSDTTKHAKIPDPELFDGRSETLKLFVSKLSNKILGNPESFPNDESKIRYGYSRLSDKVAQRVQTQFRGLNDPSVPSRVQSYSQFIVCLETYFQDPGLQKKANRKVMSLRQGLKDFQDFLAEFEDALQDSSFAANPETVLPFLQEAISQDLKASFIALPAPDNYIEFCHECKTRDARIQAQKSLNRTLPTTANGNSAPATRPPTRSTFANMIPSPRPTPTTERTVMQGGTAMDLDKISRERTSENRLTPAAKDARRALGRCLRCNVAGHLAVDCRPSGEKDLRVFNLQPHSPLDPQTEQSQQSQTPFSEDLPTLKD